MSTTHDLGIVVGVDGSPASRVAVDWAARDASLRNRPLTLVHVANPVMATWSQSPLPGDFGTWQRQRGQSFLDDAVEVARRANAGKGQLEPQTEIRYAATVPGLVELSQEADMVVVGSTGQGAFGSRLGSVSAGLVNHAHCPVAVIHDEDPRCRSPPRHPFWWESTAPPHPSWRRRSRSSRPRCARWTSSPCTHGAMQGSSTTPVWTGRR